MERQYEVRIRVGANGPAEAAEVAFERLRDGEEPDSVELIWNANDSHSANCASRIVASAECTCGKADYLSKETE